MRSCFRIMACASCVGYSSAVLAGQSERPISDCVAVASRACPTSTATIQWLPVFLNWSIMDIVDIVNLSSLRLLSFAWKKYPAPAARVNVAAPIHVLGLRSTLILQLASLVNTLVGPTWRSDSSESPVTTRVPISVWPWRRRTFYRVGLAA